MKDTKELTKNIEHNKEYLVPAVDIYETDEDYRLKADMPGIDKAGLEVVVEEETLTIKGESEVVEQNEVYKEFKPRNYMRSFRLGNGIQKENISANLESGVLTLTLPKAEKIKPRKIEISGE